MSIRFPIIAVALSVLLIGMISCSGGNTSADMPTAPELTIDRSQQAFENSHYVLAFAQIHYDPATNDADVVPLRQVMGHWNVLQWLEQGPCTNCVAVVGVSPTPSGTKKFQVEIMHPFPIDNLTGFDVRGIAMFKGSQTFPVAGLTTPDRTVGDGELIDAAGYTTLYNASTEGSGPGGLQGYIKGKFGNPVLVPDAELNGYMRHISPGGANIRNAFYAGGITMAIYELDMPDTGFYFNYCVDANWAPPTTKPVTDPMTDFPPEANCPEPWKIEVDEDASGGGLHTAGGETILEIDVYDWQGKDSHADPVVECPELFTGTVTATWVSDGSGFAGYEATIQNTKLAGIGEYEVLISVVDDENATAPDWLDLSAYQIVTVGVVEAGNLPPTAIPKSSITQAYTSQNINFYDNSTDPDGYDDITNWAWDMSYVEGDGFNVENTSQFFSYSYLAAGSYDVMLRVTDSESHEDMADTPLTITVTYLNQPPTANFMASANEVSVGQTINFTDTSTDPDGPGDMVLWQWDFSYFYPDDYVVDSTDEDPSWSYSTPGVYEVYLRVTDTASNVDWTDWPFTITVTP